MKVKIALKPVPTFADVENAEANGPIEKKEGQEEE